MTNEILAFKLGNEFYGLEIDNVIEIVKKQRINEIPLPGECVKGVVNIRGNIATVFDLYKFLNIDSAEDEYFIICRNQEMEKNMVFPVSDIVGILKKDESNNISEVSSFKGLISSSIKYIYELDDKLVLVLDFEKVRNNISMSKKNEYDDEHEKVAEE